MTSGSFHIPVRTKSVANLREHWSRKARRTKSERAATRAAWIGAATPYPLDQLVTVLGRRRLRFTCERDLQDAIAELLTEAGIEYHRELALNAHDRPDFMVGRLALEVKVDGSLASLTRQIHRYAQSDAVEGILVVTSLARHTNLPEAINGRPVRVLHLIGSVL